MTAPTTLGRASFLESPNGERLFRVNAGASISDALETVSLLQFYANQLTLEAALNDGSERFSWPAYYLGQMAKALLDDVSDSMFAARAEP